MNLMKCDICGKMMTWDEWQRKDTACATLRIHKEDGKLSYYNDDIDFCEECTVDFLKWLKGAKNEG